MSGRTEGTKVKSATGHLAELQQSPFEKKRVLVCEMKNLESAAERLERDECERHDENDCMRGHIQLQTARRVTTVCGCGSAGVRGRWFLGAYVHSAHPASVAMVTSLTPNQNVHSETLKIRKYRRQI